MMIKMISRDACAVSGKTDLEPLDTLRNFPIFMGCTKSAQADDEGANMSWAISRGSGAIQLQKLIPIEILYRESHGSGCVGMIWQNHHQAFARFLRATRPLAVFEIGGGHGVLAKTYRSAHSIPWTILEPNPSPVDDSRARFIRGFFDKNFIFKGPFDTVVHSHVFEHIYEPAKFMWHLSKFISPGKHLVFSLPNMLAMLKNKHANCLNFEHTVLLSEAHIEFLLSQHGFRLKRKLKYLKDHSIFYCAVRDPKVIKAPLPKNLRKKYIKLYRTYGNYFKKLVPTLNQIILRKNRKVFLFGAHIFSQFLIAHGLNVSKVWAVLDNDTSKQGKRLYGTPLKVYSPEILRSEKQPLVILKAGSYNREIKKQILQSINRETRFL